MLDARRLRVLCEVARQGSFSGAATAMGYTQPAISRQIATLEAEVGTALVRRVPHGAFLTDAGRVLVECGEAILIRIAEAEAELEALAGLDGGRLRLAAFGSAAATIVPLAVARFRDLHPRIDLEVTMAEPADALVAVRAGELDLAIANDATLDPDAVDSVHLFDDPMYAALPVDHPLAEVPGIGMGSFATEQWMLATGRACPDAALFRRACQAAGFEPRIGFQNDDYSAILGFVAAGVGVALVPDMVTRNIREDVVVRALEPPPPSRPIVALLPRGYRAPAATSMLAILREVSDAWVADRAG